MKVSNTQRSLYLQCPQKYKYRYKHKMRERDKGSALPFGVAFDQASEILFHQRDLKLAKEKFTEVWMGNEGRLSVKFSSGDLDVKIYEQSDLNKLEAAAGNLNHSKAKGEFDKHGDVVVLVKDIKKLKDQSFTRDLTDEEDQFLHYANILCMHRKGLLMLDSFYSNILPHITEVVATQFQVDVDNGQGDSIIGYIDLLCKMTGYTLPNGRVLTDDDLVVADVKTAGATYWGKLDDLRSSDQLETYVCSPQVQSIKATNLICYMAVAKNISKDETYSCEKCGNIKSSSHKKCNAEVEGKRCNGEWAGHVRYFSEAKIVIGERNLQEAAKVYSDYDGVVMAIKHDIYYRNRDSCNAYGQVCPYYNICNKACSSLEQEELEIQRWKDTYGE